MVIFGWRRFAIILGLKTDECAACGVIGPFVLVRTTWWFTVFFVPVVMLRFKHGMVCRNCGAAVGIPVLQMLRGLREGRLPLARSRPRFESLPPDAFGLRPEVAAALDPVTKNPKTSLKAWYVRLWPFLAVSVVTILVAASILNPPKRTPHGQTFDSTYVSSHGPAHDCWVQSGSINGCELQSGSLVGERNGDLTVCYFNEPVAMNEDYVYCDR